MRLRADQIAELRTGSLEFRRQLAAVLAACGTGARLDPRTADVVVPGRNAGTLRLCFENRDRPALLRYPDGRAFRLEYDARERVSALVDRAGGRTQIRYTDDGRVREVCDPCGRWTRIDYDESRPIVVRRSDGRELRFGYDPAGHPATVTDGRGHGVQMQFRDDLLLECFVERGGRTTTYRYDDARRLVELTTPSGALWHKRYDDAAERVEIVGPHDVRESFEYRRGSLAAMTRRDGSRVTFESDDAGRIARIAFGNEMRVALTYDALGRVASADHGGKVARFETDDAGRRTAELIGDVRIELAYTSEGLLERLGNDRGEHVAFRYGDDQRLAAIVDWSGLEYGIEHDAAGYVVRIVYPGALEQTRSFTAIGLPEHDRVVRLGGDIERSYAYDANDMLVSLRDQIYGERAYTFDDDDRLVEVRSHRGMRRIAYDAHDNVTAFDSIGFAYDAVDRLTSASGVEHRYDASGNVVERTRAGTRTGHGYNALQQMIWTELPDGRRVHYEYDAFGRRTLKKLGSRVTHFVWGGELLLAEETTGPIRQRVDYLYLPGTHRPLAMRVDGETFYYQVDHLDTPVRLFDETGQIVWAAEPEGYDFFQYAFAVRQPLRFRGQYHDEETGLFYNVGRYYDPALGRYLTPDPYFFIERANPYAYTSGNPVMYTDPSGRLLPLAIIAIGAGIGAVVSMAHRAASNWANDRPLGEGLLGAAGRGLVAGAAGTAGFLVGGPAAGFAAGVAAAGLLAAAEAPEGQGTEACMETIANSVPFLPAWDRYQQSGNGRQLAVDMAFDTLGVGLMALGIKGGRGGPPGALPSIAMMETTTGVRVPVLVPAAVAAPAAAGAAATGGSAVAMASMGGGGGRGEEDKPKVTPKDSGFKKNRKAIDDSEKIKGQPEPSHQAAANREVVAAERLAQKPDVSEVLLGKESDAFVNGKAGLKPSVDAIGKTTDGQFDLSEGKGGDVTHAREQFAHVGETLGPDKIRAQEVVIDRTSKLPPGYSVSDGGWLMENGKLVRENGKPIRVVRLE